MLLRQEVLPSNGCPVHDPQAHLQHSHLRLWGSLMGHCQVVSYDKVTRPPLHHHASFSTHVSAPDHGIIKQLIVMTATACISTVLGSCSSTFSKQIRTWTQEKERLSCDSRGVRLAEEVHSLMALLLQMPPAKTSQCNTAERPNPVCHATA